MNDCDTELYVYKMFYKALKAMRIVYNFTFFLHLLYIYSKGGGGFVPFDT